MASLWQKVKILVKQAVTGGSQPGQAPLPERPGEKGEPVGPQSPALLEKRLEQFEEKYGIDSDVFYQQYQAGLFEQEGEFKEWAAAVARLKGQRW